MKTKCKEIIFVTGNKLKYAAAKKYFALTKYKITRKKIECPEIQNADPAKVVSYSVKYLVDKLKKPVVKTDQGFFIEALNGFPGAYMHDIEKMIGEKGFKQIMNEQKNRNAKYVEVLAFCEPNKKPVLFFGEIKGKLALVPSGKNGYIMDRLFIPNGKSKLIANYSNEELNKVYEFGTWPKFIEFLNKK